MRRFVYIIRGYGDIFRGQESLKAVLVPGGVHFTCSVFLGTFFSDIELCQKGMGNCDRGRGTIRDRENCNILIRKFWALKPGALKMSDIVEKNNIWDISMETMENALMNLRKEYRHAVEESSVSLDNRQGISLELDESQVEDIRRGGSTIIDVCPEIFCCEDCENPFSGMYDVRVKAVKVLLDNLQFAGTNQKVRVSVTQMGEEKCMDRSQIWHTFHHEPCTTLYEYDVVDGKETIDGSLEDQRSKSWEESRALIGPFAKWKIAIQGSANKKMDYSRITGGRIEFLICFRPL